MPIISSLYNNHRFAVKRLFDIFAAIICLILVAPLWVLVACWIKGVSPGPVYFRQERMGYRGRRFIMFKFRSMQLDAETQSHKDLVEEQVLTGKPMTKMDCLGDPRIIWGGGLLRAACFDELPQLINVIRGEMSMVGPRPCLECEYELYSTSQKERFHAKPGLTGYWQVTGKNATTFTEMVNMDIYYIKSMSLWLDLKIMFKTIPVIFRQLRWTTG